VLAAVIPIVYLLLSNTKPKVFLKPQEWQELKLTEKEVHLNPLLATHQMAQFSGQLHTHILHLLPPVWS
jgi:hypothetical protein